MIVTFLMDKIKIKRVVKKKKILEFSSLITKVHDFNYYLCNFNMCTSKIIIPIISWCLEKKVRLKFKLVLVYLFEIFLI